jgi:cytochrome c biogenesis protein CcdA
METEKQHEISARTKLSIELRQKYELYFVSIAFTLAGLSVQTATHAGPQWRLFIEVIGWTLLSFAGFLGYGVSVNSGCARLGLRTMRKAKRQIASLRLPLRDVNAASADLARSSTPCLLQVLFSLLFQERQHYFRSHALMITDQ